MAVSGRKISDFQGSILQGSAEDFAHSCDSCLTDNQQVEAHGFCVNCQEYLCNHCLRCHQRTKASKHHQLLGKDEMDKHASSTKPAEVCTEKCSIHTNEIIKFFCSRHDEIGCSDCMIMKHRTCDLDYIPDKCAGIGDSEEFKVIMRTLEEKLEDASTVMKKATCKNKEIECSNDKVDEEFATFRKELNDHLDSLQKAIVTDADKKKSSNKQKVQEVLSSCTQFTIDMKKLQSALQQSKTGGQNGQIFIEMKRVKSRLQLQDLQQAEFTVEKINTQITFIRNKDIETIFSIKNFGKLTELSRVVVTSPTARAAAPARAHADAAPTTHDSAYSIACADETRIRTAFSSVTHKTYIKVKTKSNRITCQITGIAELSSSKIVLADYNNNTLKLVDIQKQTVLKEKKLDSEPYDITVLPQDRIAVTLPNMKQILIMKTTDKLSIDSRIATETNCRGISYHQDGIYVLCRNPNRVDVLDTTGKLKTTIFLIDTAVFSFPNFLVPSQDHKHFYVSNFESNSVVSVTLQGEISAVYKDTNLVGPSGMLVLDDGSLMVCCKDNVIYNVSANLKQGQKVVECLKMPKCACYVVERSQIYVGCNSDQLQVFDILW